MSKRFTDSEKWDRPWFRALEPKYKLLWLYICDKCDAAGMWHVDLELALFYAGIPKDSCTIDQLKKALEKQIIDLDGSKWLIKDFIHFQCGERYMHSCFPHRNVKKKLESIERLFCLNGLIPGWSKGASKIGCYPSPTLPTSLPTTLPTSLPTTLPTSLPTTVSLPCKTKKRTKKRIKNDCAGAVPALQISSNRTPTHVS